MAKKTLFDLAADIENFSKELPDQLHEIKVRGAEFFLGTMVYETPVDTSQAISNWQVSFGPSVGFRGPHIEGKHGSTYEASAARAFQVGVGRLAESVPGQSVFIVNRAPYISKLERGHSPQNAGFVQRGIDALGSFLERERAGVNDG